MSVSAFPYGTFANVVPSLSGNSNTASNSGANATAEFKVDQDGNMYERDNVGSWVQINTPRDWLRPTSQAPGDWRVRYTNAVGDTADLTVTAAEDAWHSLSGGDFILTLVDSTSGPATKTVTFDLELDRGGGTALESGSYTLTADRNDA